MHQATTKLTICCNHLSQSFDIFLFTFIFISFGQKGQTLMYLTATQNIFKYVAVSSTYIQPLYIFQTLDVINAKLDTFYFICITLIFESYSSNSNRVDIRFTSNRHTLTLKKKKLEMYLFDITLII